MAAGGLSAESAESGGATSEAAGTGEPTVGGSSAGGSDGGATSVGEAGTSTGGADTGGLESGGTAGNEAGAGGTDGELLGLPVAFVVEPTLAGNDNPAVPQAAILRLQTDVEATVSVTVSGGDEEWTLELPAATTFEKPIVGVKPDIEYSVSLSVTAGANTLVAGPLTWTSPPLPTDFIPLQVTVSDPSRMEPGMTLFAVRDGWQMVQSPILIVDQAGVVRWYFRDPDNLVQEDLRLLPNGNLFFGRDFCSLREIDLLGNVVSAWHTTEWPRTCDIIEGSIPVAAVDFHHESLVMPSGNILTLTTETRTIDDFPTDEDDATAPTESALVMGSSILEFTPQGEIVKRISMLDLLDPTRIGRDTFDTMWPSQHAAAGQRPFDWDHANAVIYDADSDSYLVSLRHQDAVIKVERASETLTWILGTPANWEAPWSDKLLAPSEGLLWPFHQHAIEINALGIGLYDNGNYRAAAFEPIDPAAPEYSRAVIFAVDETAMTVSEVWSYGPTAGEESFFSTGMGDADRQPTTGNVLLTSSERVIPAETPLGEDTTYAQIVEVTGDGTRVFELSTLGEEGTAYPVYRADRIPDIRR